MINGGGAAAKLETGLNNGKSESIVLAGEVFLERRTAAAINAVAISPLPVVVGGWGGEKEGIEGKKRNCIFCRRFCHVTSCI